MTTRTIVAALVSLLLADAAGAQSCTEDKTAVIIEGGTRFIDFPQDVGATQYATGSGEEWNDLLSDAITVTGNTDACLVNFPVFGPFDGAADALTFFHCECIHVLGEGVCDDDDSTTEGVPAGCEEYHTTAGLAPANSAGTTIERHRLWYYGDGVSIADSSGPVMIAETWIRWAHDDAVETDWLKHNVTVASSFLDDVFMAFAFDARSAADNRTPPAGYTHVYYNNLISLKRFTNAYKQRPGHGGVFKDDQNGKNPDIWFVGNKIKLGPVAGSGQLQFPIPADTIECLNNVYLWDGTNTAYNAMLATSGNGSNLTALRNAWGGDDCIVVVKREDVCPSCVVDADGGSAQFRAMNLTALDGNSWDYIVNVFTITKFGSGSGPPPGCGIGPELALALPLLGAWRRRARGRAPSRG